MMAKRWLLGLSIALAPAGCIFSADPGASDDAPPPRDAATDAATDAAMADAGADADADEVDSGGALCRRGERVLGGVCAACPPGTTREAGDDPRGADTECDPIRCKVDERVEANQCISCPPGTINEAGDDARKANTACDVTLCEADKRVLDHECVPCPDDTTNDRDDDASGGDTFCDDRCTPLIGVDCATFHQGELNEQDPRTGDSFGTSVAWFNQRGIAVGAPTRSKVEIFTRASEKGPLSFQSSLSQGASEQFGSALAVGPDLLLVGAPGEEGCDDGVRSVEPVNKNCVRAGAAYLYKRDGASWDLIATLKSSTSEEEYRFGESVALSPDGRWAAVGEPYATVDGADGERILDAGLVHLFEISRPANPTPSVTNRQTLNIKIHDMSEVRHLDKFGAAIAMNNDTIAIGAPNEENCKSNLNGGGSYNCPASGAIFTWKHEQTNISNNSWTFSRYIKRKQPEKSADFGNSIDINEEWIAVGEKSRNGCGVDVRKSVGVVCSNAGEVTLVQRADPKKQISFKPSNLEGRDEFGFSVSLQPNYIAVGANEEDGCSKSLQLEDPKDNACTDAGAVYIFSIDSESMTVSQHAYIKSTSPREGDWFGFSVALRDNEVAIGAPKRDDEQGIEDSGEVSIRVVGPVAKRLP